VVDVSRNDDKPTDEGPPEHAPASSAEPPFRTRAGLAWVAVCTAALIAVAFLVFIVQNTQTVHVSFLWFDGDTSLAVAVLVSAVGGSIVTLVFGTARIVQLRRALKDRA
jgi:uncharacterized integral membrane protein